MKKTTLHFPSLQQLCTFSKVLQSGYLVNTVNLTFTGNLTEADIRLGIDNYKADIVVTDGKGYSYDV